MTTEAIDRLAAARPALSDQALQKIDAYWRAANYLSVGQIYLRDNPLLREPLKLQHVKPRLLGHWGTCPGQNLVYAHLNRIIRKRFKWNSAFPVESITPSLHNFGERRN